MEYAVYILASDRNGTLYVGVTNNLSRRIQQHRDGEGGEFTKKYATHQLVYFEYFREIKDALNREKQLKNWKRRWKIDLIEEHNPSWDDLASTL